MNTYENTALEIKTNTQLSFRRNGVEGIAVRVENESDIKFWQPIINKALPNKSLRFYSIFQNDTKAKGIGDMKKYMDFADNQLIFCRDADYDYFLENPVLSKPFVFHTYVYAIENAWSCADGLQKVIEQAFGTVTQSVMWRGGAIKGVDFDFVLFFKKYSDIIYDGLLCSLFYEKQKREDTSKNKNEQLAPAKFGKLATSFKLNDIDNELVILKERLLDFRKEFDSNPKFKAFEAKLSSLGFNRETAYLFLHSHSLFDNITLKLMKMVGDPIHKSQIENLKTLGDKEGLKILQFSTRHSYSTRLQAHNDAFENTIFYAKILSDFESAFN